MNMFKKQSMRTVHGLQCYFFNQNNCIKVTFYPRRHYRTIWVFGMGNSGKTQQCALQLATVSGKMVETPDLCHLIQFMHPTIYAWGLSVLSLSTRSSSTFFIYSRSNFFFFFNLLSTIKYSQKKHRLKSDNSLPSPSQATNCSAFLPNIIYERFKRGQKSFREAESVVTVITCWTE